MIQAEKRLARDPAGHGAKVVYLDTRRITHRPAPGFAWRREHGLLTWRDHALMLRRLAS